MEYLTKFHKLITYTDKNMITYHRKFITVLVYAKAVLSDELMYIRDYPSNEVVSDPILIEIRMPLGDMVVSDEEILINGECLAQIAAVSPDIFNLFGTKKGINITELLLISSQPLLKRYIEFDDCDISSEFTYQCLKWNGLYFYGAVTRDITNKDMDWVLPLINGGENRIPDCKITHTAISKKLYINTRTGRFFLTQTAIKQFLALPHIFTKDDVNVTRPFRAVTGVFRNKLQEPHKGSSLDLKAPNEKVLISLSNKLIIFLNEDNTQNGQLILWFA